MSRTADDDGAGGHDDGEQSDAVAAGETAPNDGSDGPPAEESGPDPAARRCGITLGEW